MNINNNELEKLSRHSISNVDKRTLKSYKNIPLPKLSIPKNNSLSISKKSSLSIPKDNSSPLSQLKKNNSLSISKKSSLSSSSPSPLHSVIQTKVPEKKDSVNCPRNHIIKNILDGDKQISWYQISDEDLQNNINILKPNQPIILEIWKSGHQGTMIGTIKRVIKHKNPKKMIPTTPTKLRQNPNIDENYVDLNGKYSYEITVKNFITDERTELPDKKHNYNFFSNPERIDLCNNKKCDIIITIGMNGTYDEMTGTLKVFSTNFTDIKGLVFIPCSQRRKNQFILPNDLRGHALLRPKATSNILNSKIPPRNDISKLFKL